MLKTKNLETIQPVSNLQNYSKNITPILDSNKSVTLTKNGKVYGVISSPEQAEENSEYKELIAHLFVKYAHKIGSQKLYTIDEAKRELKKYELQSKNTTKSNKSSN